MTNSPLSTRIARATLIASAFAVTFWLGCVSTQAGLDQPKMRDAVEHLQKARRSLQDATEDKGGHRAAAIRLTDEAIEQVRKGIAFDRNNLSPNENQK